MTPSARIAAAIEILADYLPILTAERQGPALDVYLQRAFRRRRYAGSSDRAAITGLVYASVRGFGRLRWRLESAGQVLSARHAVLLQLTIEGRLGEVGTGEGPYDAEPVSEAEAQWLARAAALSSDDGPAWARWNLPEWMLASIESRFGEKTEIETELAALDKRAPTDIRVNPLKTDRPAMLTELAESGHDGRPTPLSPYGIRLWDAPGLAGQPIMKEGRAAIQDEGSQIMAILCDAKPKQQIAEMCAGAGGKSLFFAAQMNNTGQIYAYDVDKKRIETLKQRCQKAGVRNIQPKVVSARFGDRRARVLEPRKGHMHRVIVDAPCSGSGTWRRNPELKWRMTAGAVDALCLEQADLVAEAAGLVAPGGRLVYITCSILPEENENQVRSFLDMNPNWSLVPFDEVWADAGLGRLGANRSLEEGCLQLTPACHETDGFFIAIFRRLSDS